MSEELNHTIYVTITKMYEVKLESTRKLDNAQVEGLAEEMEQHLGDYLGNDRDIDHFPNEQGLPLQVRVEECHGSSDWSTEMQVH